MGIPVLPDPIDFLNNAQSKVTGHKLPTTGGIVGKADDLLAKDKRVSISSILGGAGFRGSDLTTATAIALAESGGDTNVDNGICCVGLMQIHRNHAGIVGSPTNPAEFTQWLKNPHNNARAAYALYVSAGRKFTDWEAYTNGAFRKYLGQDKVITTDHQSITGEVNDAARSVVPGLSTVEDFVSTILSPDTWFRIGKTGLGLTLIVVGATTIVVIAVSRASNTNTVGAAATAAKFVK